MKSAKGTKKNASKCKMTVCI